MWRLRSGEGGFTLVEMLITILLIGTVSLSMLTLFVALVNSSIVAKREAIALTLATNQMEYLKSLPYNSLNAGTSSSGTTTMSTSKTNGVTYTITTVIKYVDDAYDGCGPYITSISASLRPDYCRNYTSSSTTNDANFNDYKIADVTVTDPGHTHLAELDTQISARVAEAASTNGALVVTVLDSSGNPLPGATVTISDTAVTPNINHTATTDDNGLVIDYGLTPDSGKDYVITASESGYSTLTTIGVSGTLQPTYPNQSVLSQQSSSSTLTLKQQGTNSLAIEATDTAGNPVSGLKIYAKGGYKKYTLSSNTAYYYDDMTALNGTTNDIRPATDSSGLASIPGTSPNSVSLVPGNYYFCGDDGGSNCKVGATTYYLVAAIPYGGSSVFSPIAIPTYDPSNPPATTYTYDGTAYLQKVRLIFSTSSSFPRVNTVSPYDVSLSGGASSFAFAVTGTNLSSATVKFLQGANAFAASCNGTSTQQNCSVNMSAASVGNTQMVLSTSGGTLTIPSTLTLGGLIVTP